MTSSDKTGEKLVASIRKSKASTASTGDKAAAEKAPRRQTTSRGSGVQAGSRNSSAAGGGASGPFAFGRRVWPD